METELNDTGLDILLVHALWFDLLACLSVDRVPHLPYEHWLKIPGFNMADVIGFENWVAQAMGDIAVLRQWKEDQQSSGSLSIFQLASKAREIQCTLEQGVKRLEVRFTSSSFFDWPYPDTFSNTGLEITDWADHKAFFYWMPDLALYGGIRPSSCTA